MKYKYRIFFETLLIVLTFFVAQTSFGNPKDQNDYLYSIMNNQNNTPARVTFKDNGFVRSIIYKKNNAYIINNKSESFNIYNYINEIIEKLKPSLGIDKESSNFSFVKKEKNKIKIFKSIQIFNSYPVFGSDLQIHFDENNNLLAIKSDLMTNDRIIDSSKLNTFFINKENAEKKAIESLVNHIKNSVENFNNDIEIEITKNINIYSTEMGIYAPSVFGKEGESLFAWKIKIDNNKNRTNNYLIYIDANSGEIIDIIYLDNNLVNRNIYDGENDIIKTYMEILVRQDSGGNPNNLPTWDNNNPFTNDDYNVADSDSLWNYLGDCYSFYYSNHQRNGHDNQNSLIKGTVRSCVLFSPCPLENAGAKADGQSLLFGEGMVADDIVSHEYTHLVTMHESELEGNSATQASVINESLSDIWGEFVDQTNNSGNDDENVKWLIGEDSTMQAIRNMKNPTSFEDPDYYGSEYWYSGANASYYCHHNTGIINKLCYLLSDGDVFRGYTIEPMGIYDTAKLFYFLQTSWLSETSDFFDLSDGIIYASDIISDQLSYTNIAYKNVVLACRSVGICQDNMIDVLSPSGEHIFQMDCFGDVYVLKGNVYQNASANDLLPSGSVKEFLVKYNNQVVFKISGDTGNVYCKGVVTNVSNLSRINSTNEFALSNSAITYSIIDKNGNLKYRRMLFD